MPSEAMLLGLEIVLTPEILLLPLIGWLNVQRGMAHSAWGRAGGVGQAVGGRTESWAGQKCRVQVEGWRTGGGLLRREKNRSSGPGMCRGQRAERGLPAGTASIGAARPANQHQRVAAELHHGMNLWMSSSNCV